MRGTTLGCKMPPMLLLAYLPCDAFAFILDIHLQLPLLCVAFAQALPSAVFALSFVKLHQAKAKFRCSCLGVLAIYSSSQIGQQQTRSRTAHRALDIVFHKVEGVLIGHASTCQAICSLEQRSGCAGVESSLFSAGTAKEGTRRR